ncbi:hypothetical protein ACFY71_29160 [Streptomyces cinerochromogenes]
MTEAVDTRLGEVLRRQGRYCIARTDDLDAPTVRSGAGPAPG